MSVRHSILKISGFFSITSLEEKIGLYKHGGAHPQHRPRLASSPTRFTIKLLEKKYTDKKATTTVCEDYCKEAGESMSQTYELAPSYYGMDFSVARSGEAVRYTDLTGDSPDMTYKLKVTAAILEADESGANDVTAATSGKKSVAAAETSSRMMRT